MAIIVNNNSKSFPIPEQKASNELTPLANSVNSALVAASSYSAPPLNPSRVSIKDQIAREEQTWKEKLGSRLYSFEQGEKVVFMLYKSEDEIFKFAFSHPEFSNIFLNSEGAAIKEEKKEALLSYLQKTIRKFKERSRFSYDDFAIENKQDGTFYIIFNKRQVKELLRRTDDLGIFFKNLQWHLNEHRDFCRKLVLNFEELQQEEGGQEILNELMRQYNCAMNTEPPVLKINRGISEMSDLSALVMKYASIENENVAFNILEYAVVMNRSEKVAEILKRHPRLLQLSSSLVAIAIQKGCLETAKVLLGHLRESQAFYWLICLLKRCEKLEEIESAAVREFIAFLLNQKSDLPDEETLENAYLYQGKNEELIQELAEILIKNGGMISEKTARRIKAKLQIVKDEKLLACLKVQNRITKGETQNLQLLWNPLQGSEEVQKLLADTFEAVHYLEKMIPVYHLNPLLISLERIKAIRTLKKRLKKVPELKEALESLKAKWSQLSLHHRLLKELKDIRKKEIAKKEPSKRLVRLYSLFSEDKHYSCENGKKEVQVLFKPEGKVIWNQLVEKMFSVAMKVEQDLFLRENSLVWFHGTNAKNLPILKILRGIEPLTHLLQKGVAPLFGDFFLRGQQTVNKDHISGEMLTFNWQEGEGFIFNASTRLLVTYLYAMQEVPQLFNAEQAWKLVQNFEEEMKNKASYKDEDIFALRLAILRLRMTDPKADQRLESLKCLVANQLDNHLQRVHEALTVDHNVKLSTDELKECEKSYPIVFASTTAAPKRPESWMEGISKEQFLFFGRAELGRDVQVAFTQAEHVQELQEALKSFHIRVYDIEAAFYLEFKQMCLGSSHEKKQNKRMQKQIAHTLQHDILPSYASPYPEHPEYSDETGKSVPVPHPSFGGGSASYADYIRKIEEGEILPRDLHGPMHAVRHAIFSQLLAAEDIYNIDPGKRAFLAIAGAAHDWRRQHDGKDYWDRASALALKAYLLSRGFALEEIEEYIFAIEHKDPTGDLFTSFIQRIIHDADVLEMFRLLEEHQFDKNFLSFYKDPKIALKDKDQLIAEIREFIKITENVELQKRLERTSKNYYGDVLRLLKELHDKEKRFPMLVERLKDVIEPFCV